ncbi:hypothetical protein JHW43_006176 [Diplocarpon mali]|nr:hypothetical protein JHW43_006176 [Diplocarpon mali]
MISKAAEQSTAFCDLQTHTVQSALDNVCPTVAISTALPPCGETERISTPDTTTAPENPLSSTDSDTDGPCGVTTRPVNGEGTLEEISHNASDAVHKSISGYEITTQQDEQFVCTSEMVLNGIEHNFGTWYETGIRIAALPQTPQQHTPPPSPKTTTPRMLKIWSMKQKQQQDANADAAAGNKKKKVTAAQLRVQKDLSELSLPSTMKTDFPDPDDTLNFKLTIEPDEGMYKGGRFHFTFAISQGFPHEAPKVKCTQKIYHPNIDLEGNVCLNILREDWKPVLNLQAVIVGLQFLFLEPNASDPLNKEAAEDLRSNREGFKRNVRSAMGGGAVRSQVFDRVLKT